MRGDGDRDRRVHSGQLLDGERVGKRVGAGAPVFLGEGDAHQAELRKAGDDLVGKAVLAIELGGYRGELTLGKLPHRAAQELVLVGEVEVHRDLDLWSRSLSEVTTRRICRLPSAGVSLT